MWQRLPGWTFSSSMSLFVLTLALSTGGTANPPAVKEARPTNRLARETSPYLLMHAHNPVDWYPWGPDAFAKAKKEGKLVFLSIGYSSCYWCHVMERESFENQDVARLLNQWFVCIKVDREERPDIDSIYMTALNVLDQHGGWPLSMFLGIDAKPIFGGTYWPPEDKTIEVEGKKGKVLGFKGILKRVRELQESHPKDLQVQAEKVAALTAEALERVGRGIALVDLDRKLVAAAVDSFREEFDPEHGGFSRARNFKGTKFPVPPTLSLLLHEAKRTKSSKLSDMVAITLDHMARGGIYDQLGGGFHRYSTERTWTVPHFEKMLYDNAQLVEIYAHAYALTPKPEYRRVIRETLAFIKREMTSPDGAFYSALDAETGGEEGRYYVWTDQELDSALAGTADGALFKKVTGADAGLNFESKYHVLTLPKTFRDAANDARLTENDLEKRLAPVRERLFSARSVRSRPFLDRKVLTGWNGQMIAGYAVAGRILSDQDYIATAARAADFILARLRQQDGRLLRTYGAQPGKSPEARLNAYLEDYAFLVHGLLCLHDATGDKKWLDVSKSLIDAMIQHFGDPDRGGFFFTSNDHEKLFARAKDQYDGAQPSGNSLAARNLVQLWKKTGEDRYRAQAEKSFKSFAGSLKLNPTSLPAMADALAVYLDVNDGRPAKPVAKEKTPETGKSVKSDSKVKVTATTLKPDADGRQAFSVQLDIEKGWHLYANPVPEDFPGLPTTVSVGGKVDPKDIKVEYPQGDLIKGPEGVYKIYQGKTTIKASVRRAKGDASPLELKVELQACSDTHCLLPATVVLKVSQ